MQTQNFVVVVLNIRLQIFHEMTCHCAVSASFNTCSKISWGICHNKGRLENVGGRVQDSQLLNTPIAAFECVYVHSHLQSRQKLKEANRTPCVGVSVIRRKSQTDVRCETKAQPNCVRPSCPNLDTFQRAKAHERHLAKRGVSGTN